MQNIELEQMVLGAIIARQDNLSLLPSDFDIEHFYEGLHQDVFAKIRELASNGEKFDAIILKGFFNKDDAIQRNYLVKLVAASINLTDIETAAKQLIDLANKRKIISFCQEAILISQNEDSERQSGEIASWLVSQIDGINTATRFRLSTERQVSERLVERLQKGEPIPCSQTGIDALDAAMGGGLFQHKLYGIVGRKKMGKTMLSGTISHNLQKSGQRHLYLALEMGSDEIHQRSLAREADCKEAVFRLGANDKIIEKMADYAVNTKNYRLYIDAPSLSFDDLRHLLPQYIKRYKIKGFILDCWQLVGGKLKNKSSAEHLDDVAQWLAEICKRYPVWGLVTAQENQDNNTRGGEGLRLASDQLYRIMKNNPDDVQAWLEMMDTRYTRWIDVGDKDNPRLQIHENGTHFFELGY